MDTLSPSGVGLRPSNCTLALEDASSASMKHPPRHVFDLNEGSSASTSVDDDTGKRPRGVLNALNGGPSSPAGLQTLRPLWRVLGQSLQALSSSSVHTCTLLYSSSSFGVHPHPPQRDFALVHASPTLVGTFSLSGVGLRPSNCTLALEDASSASMRHPPRHAFDLNEGFLASTTRIACLRRMLSLGSTPDAC
ncbi:hypothetical protein C8Q76DRAFT_797899 [Earliella scabrosa]|nr:hypothetical protein C8Q76DRAFT_797899 [Earliella scabrosa]